MSTKHVAATLVVAAAATALFVNGCGTTGNPVPADNAAALAGQMKFNATCAGCHVAAFLRPSADLITNNMGIVNSRMSGITLTDEEVADLQAYLATQ